ncbi:hypothetical protein CK203_043755 [Vitis vinifera]|uniref:Uncharacterized protein n=1 Tax=Vitis vinifera TaxID=29760 RepID=A0A438HW18_VITVI|nr:hypothetical protein CK203_043755 [Vitis vinifera]
MVKLVLIPSQLRMDSFLRCGSKSSRFGAGIWVFYFLAQKCPDGLSKHTLRSPSQTLGMNGNPNRERERERERELTVSSSCSILVSNDKAIIISVGQLGAMALHIREDLRLSGRRGLLNGANGLDRMSLDALKAVRAVVKEVTCGLVGMMPRRQTMKSLLCSLSPSAFCISNHSLFVALLRRLSFSVAFAICSTATSVVIHFPDGPFNGYNPTLRWNFISNSGVSLLLGLVFRHFNSKPLWGIDTRYLEWGLALDQVLRLATVLRPVQAGPCTTEILFIYTIKISGKEIFSLSAHISSLQLVIGLPDSTKGPTKGHVIVSGLGLTDTSIRHKNLNLVVHWGFQDSQPYIVPILSRFALRVLVSGKHHVLKNLPLYEEAQATDAKARQDQLDQR